MESNPLVDSLTELQGLARSRARLTPEQKATVARIRRGVPPLVLAHFDDLLRRDCKAVVQVHNGGCNGCYVKLPTSVMPGLADELLVCETCGAYLSFDGEPARRGLAIAGG